MIHKIEFTINVETNNLNDEDYLKLQKPFYLKIANTETKPITLKELVEMLELDKKKYFPTSIEFEELKFDDNFTPKTTKIKIVG